MTTLQRAMHGPEWIFFDDIEELVAHLLPCGKALLFHEDDEDDHITARIASHKLGCEGCPS